METYTRGEVGWLLGLRREDAIACDEPGAQGFDVISTGDGTTPLPTVARWVDVHRAAAAVRATRFRDALAQDELDAKTAAILHSRGFTHREIGDALQASHTTAMRRGKSFVDDVCEELNTPC